MSVETGPTTGAKRLVPCDRCGGNVTNHTVLASATETNPAEDENGVEIGSVNIDYGIVRCEGCGSHSFRTTYITSNELPEWVPKSRARHYPPRIEGHAPLSGVEPPENIRDIYNETHTALACGSRILAGIGLRAILEAVCRNRGETRGTLEAKLDKLKERGLLSTPDSEVLHTVRDLGNDAAHEVVALPMADLLAALSVVENLLRSTFGTAHERMRQRPRKGL